ncbi:hypothetical protein FB645_001898 [Coemansia sp. IMI 203386]|nr:hypothetical protein FB645_001898 [Coemansia sp. IMI 203386]
MSYAQLIQDSVTASALSMLPQPTPAASETPLPTATGTAMNHPTPAEAKKGAHSQASSTAQTSILSIVFAGWVSFALIIAIVIARRRGKLRRSGRADTSVTALSDIEQQIGTPASLGITTLGMHHQHPKPARAVLNKTELHLLPSKPYADYLCSESPESKDKPTTESCVICLDSYSEKCVVRVLACDHVFHAACVDKWLLRRSSRCPLCNSDTRRPLGLPQRPSIVKLPS